MDLTFGVFNMSNLSRRLDIQTGLGVDFSDNFRLQDGLISNRGQVVVHEVGVTCTCRRGNAGDLVVGRGGLLNCTRCENGFLYRNSRQIMGLVINIIYQRRQDIAGFLEPGDCMLSVSPSLPNPPSDFDKIHFTWPQPTGDGQVIIRGKDYELGRSGLQDIAEDRLHYKAASAIHVEDEDNRVYYQNADFRFDGYKIIWSNGPDVGKRYSIKYNAYFEWIVFAPPHERRDKDASLGPRIGLRKKHIVNRLEDPSTDLLDKEVFQSRIKA